MLFPYFNIILIIHDFIYLIHDASIIILFILPLKSINFIYCRSNYEEKLIEDDFSLPPKTSRIINISNSKYCK